jgi:hypothetical protein
MRSAIGWFLALGGATLLSGCQRSQTQELWVAPGEYDLQLVVTERGSMTPELQQAAVRTTDASTVRIHVDSMARDSVFGSYTPGDLHALGVMVGRATPGPQLFAGNVGKGRLSLTLSPDARDAGLILEGTSAREAGEGSWRVESGATKGRFQISRR